MVRLVEITGQFQRRGDLVWSAGQAKAAPTSYRLAPNRIMGRSGNFVVYES